ncbi:hypothetical protein ULMS_19520 [Patiriisocius marinistellae]|uniref:Rad50/SbcC-type AAA domain-containing protein n=1 Tax=Patiriisocius marinistellae TaxID=2494560 RepID=A0A5J4FZ44_9FLAO|nr:AAA family ATPase [Patiriisocius marinistellae]GEQ86444.1 hypothetical protein ULMS_19520 [Patiriisocius marinistellae]
MLYINRNFVNKPEVFSSHPFKDEIKVMTEFYTKKNIKQSRYRINSRLIESQLLIEKLVKLFHGKCAYCECEIFEKFFKTAHHRPTENAMNLDGKVSKESYWWLTYEWNNLYLLCEQCSSMKKTRFPVAGKRVSYLGNVPQEKALLIDPCKKKDFDDKHFQLFKNGEILGITERGKITIEILNLNNENRKQERARKILEMAGAISMARGAANQNDINNAKRELNKLLNSEVAFLSYSIAAFKHFSLITTEKIESSKIYNAIIEEIDNSISDFTSCITMKSKVERPKITKRHKTKSNKPFPIVSPITSSIDKLSDNILKRDYFMSAKRIQKIEIVNFKIIKNLVLEFPKSKHREEPWMVLLGENGAGKSSVLQAVALTLAGEEKANNLELNAAQFVNRNTSSKTGYVRVYLEGVSDFLELKFNKDSPKFTSNYDAPKVILLAFGSTRLMSDTVDYETNKNLINLSNLFNPFATLPNIEGWLGDPKKVSVAQFDQIAIALKNVLQLPDNKLIYRRKTKEGTYELFIKINKQKQGITVKELSAGYKSIIAMTINIIREILNTWDSFKIAEGIVLVDEIGVHLHPKWKLQIISTLREIFPAMNFIITTHEPLCLRGINEGEVALMKMDENNQVIALMDLPSPKALTIEQLITSKFFGLITSFDPEIEAQLNSFYLLKSKLNPTPNEIEKLETLRRNLEHINVIDNESNLEVSKKSKINLAASSLDAGWINNPKHQEDLKQKIKAIWDKTTS